MYVVNVIVQEPTVSIRALCKGECALCRKVMQVPAEHVGGTQNVVAICPTDVSPSKVAEDRDSVLLRLKTKEEVCRPFSARSYIRSQASNEKVCAQRLAQLRLTDLLDQEIATFVDNDARMF